MNKDTITIGIIAIILAIPLIYTLPLFSYTGDSPFAQGTISIQIGETPGTNVTNGTDDGTSGKSSKGGKQLANIGLQILPDYLVKSFIVVLKQGETEHRQIVVKNIGLVTQTVRVATTLPFITFDKEPFALTPDKEKPLTLEIYGKDIGVHLGMLTATTEYLESNVPVAITINSLYADHYVSFTIPPEYKFVNANEPVQARLSVRNLEGGFITVNYILKDANNQPLLKITEEKPVETSYKEFKTLETPIGLKPGSYVWTVLVTYHGNSVGALDTFTVGKGKPSLEYPGTISKDRTTTLLLVIVVILTIHLWHKHRKKSHP